jgi:hypothetical protein
MPTLVPRLRAYYPSLCALLTELLLILLDLTLPRGLHLTLLYPFPMGWLAWHGWLPHAWLLALVVALLHTALRALFGRPPPTWSYVCNLTLMVAVWCLQITLVSRARRYVLQLAEAAAKAHASRPP